MIELEQMINKLETAIKVEQAKIDRAKIKGDGDLRIEGVLSRLERVLSGLAVTLNIDPPDLSEIVDRIDKIEFPEDRTNEILSSINKIEIPSFDGLFSNLRDISASISQVRSAIGDVKIEIDDSRFNDILVSLSNLSSRISGIKMPDLEEINATLEHLKRPRSYYFTVNRDKNLLITSVEAEQT